MGESVQIQLIVPCRSAVMFHEAIQQYLNCFESGRCDKSKYS